MGGGSRRWLGLVALTIGVAMIIVDATIVNVAIPSIIRDLGIGITQAEWANSIYSLVFAALLISVGRVGDVGGRRRVFVLGLLVFLAASLVTALAPNGSVLLAGRFLQGVGAALILPSTLAIVNATFRGRERAIAFGIWGSTIGGMADIRVVDRGPGVAAAERDRLFKPFQRFGDSGQSEGVGLGLAVAKGFVEAMGGQIEADDTPGGGLTIVTRLRAAE